VTTSDKPETELESSITSRQECLLYTGDYHRASRFQFQRGPFRPPSARAVLDFSTLSPAF
jgi:hypothetical protein